MSENLLGSELRIGDVVTLVGIVVGQKNIAYSQMTYKNMTVTDVFANHIECINVKGHVLLSSSNTFWHVISRKPKSLIEIGL